MRTAPALASRQALAIRPQGALWRDAVKLSEEKTLEPALVPGSEQGISSASPRQELCKAERR
jgi:hypothetical protein